MSLVRSLSISRWSLLGLAGVVFAPGCGTSASDGGTGGASNATAGAGAAGSAGVAESAGVAGSAGIAGSANPSGGAGGGAGSSSNTPATTKLSGGFSVNLDGLSSLTSIGGNVYAGEQLSTVVWTTRATSGGCSLRTPSQPFCDPACGADACVEGDRCVPYPKPVSVGNVTVRGLGAAEFSMGPKGDTFYYVTPTGVTLPYPPAGDGAPIRFEGEGGDFGPFALESEGILPLALTSSSPLEVAPNAPLEITWTPGASQRARISIELDLSHHGGTKGQVICDLEDTGSVSIGAELVTELIGLGLAGFPALDVVRTSKVATNVAAGSIALTVRSAARLDVSVPGLVSCSGSEDCPTGQTCQPDLQCQ